MSHQTDPLELLLAEDGRPRRGKTAREMVDELVARGEAKSNTKDARARVIDRMRPHVVSGVAIAVPTTRKDPVTRSTFTTTEFVVVKKAEAETGDKPRRQHKSGTASRR